MRDLSESDKTVLFADLLRANDERIKAVRQMEVEVATLRANTAEYRRQLEAAIVSKRKAHRALGAFTLMVLLWLFIIILIIAS